MRRTTPLRNAAIATILAMLLSFGWWLPAVMAQGTAVIRPTDNIFVVTGEPGSVVEKSFTITNNTGNQVTYTLSAGTNTTPANLVTITFPSQQIVVGPGPNTSQSFTVLFNFAATAPSGTKLGTTTITASATGSTGSTILQLTTTGTAPTATPTATGTIGPTGLPSPTQTPRPICVGGQQEFNDPGNVREDAQLIRVNVPETHGLCSINEETRSFDVDWFFFGAGAGKVYTIDINQMSAGMDLVLELYDANGVQVAFNDDFFQRNPNNTSDIRPRIQSWRAPYEGFFYILVRDKLNTSGGDRTYQIEVRAESFGPTPTQIAELCIDLYEQDGLPETAKDIFPNEIQPQHVLCPTGDADWVRFYGAAGKSYFMFTDTRQYKNNPDFNRETQSGADTIMFLFDRDGVTKLDESDDIPDSLDSEIRFVPPVDGFYFVQVKNRGDLGSQFIRYDLTLKLCVSGDTACGRAQPIAVPQQTPNPGAGITPTPDPGFIVATPGPSPLPSVRPSASPSPSTLPTFLSFSRVWQRADQPVAAGQVSRSWMWGPRPLQRISEDYSNAPGGDRLVEYYDKARMEITDPAANRSSQWYVTNGLLVVEMARGQMQTGDTTFASRAAATIPIAGDQDDTNAPIYASLTGVIARNDGDRTGEYVAETLQRNGQTGDYSGERQEAARLVRYVPETGHNIAQAFWSFLNARGTISENNRTRQGQVIEWLFTLGYPISDPYWANVTVGGEPRQVLVQPFERRVLTYDPTNPAGWQVEMGNVGRHYFEWRYGRELPES